MSDFFFESKTSGFYENGVEITGREGLIIAVTEEQAVDSYNEYFTCTYTLSLEKARELNVLITKWFEGKSGNHP
jgi:hypothetical protein